MPGYLANGTNSNAANIPFGPIGNISASNVQAAIAETDTEKAPTASPTFTGAVVFPSTTTIGNVSSTELGYVDGVTGAIQTQINAKAPISNPTFTGFIVSGSGTFTKSTDPGSIALDSGATDTPALLMYYANNKNWGIDSFNNGSSQTLRFVTDLNETGGSTKAYIDSNGNFTSNNISDSGWIAVSSFSNSFTAPTAVAYRKLNGVVYVRGNVFNGTANTTAFTLPVGYRPSIDVVVPVQQYGSSNINYVSVYTNGTVVPNGTAAWLSSIVFPVG